MVPRYAATRRAGPVAASIPSFVAAKMEPAEVAEVGGEAGSGDRDGGGGRGRGEEEGQDGGGDAG